jgi:hypothetical protein
MANTASFDADADMAGRWLYQGLPGQFEFAGTDSVNDPIGHFGMRHFSLPNVGLQWRDDLT